MNFIDTLLILIMITLLIIHLTKGDIFNFIYRIYINYKNKLFKYNDENNIDKKEKKKKTPIFVKKQINEEFSTVSDDDFSLPPIEFTDI